MGRNSERGAQLQASVATDFYSHNASEKAETQKERNRKREKRESQGKVQQEKSSHSPYWRVGEEAGWFGVGVEVRQQGEGARRSTRRAPR